MENNKKRRDPRRIYSAVMYCALAFCMVTVVGTSLYTLFYDYGEYEVSIPEISMPRLELDTSTDLPVIQNPPNVTDDESEPPETGEEPVINETVYVDPVGGEILKPFSMDALIRSETMGDYRTHSGIDIKAEISAPVLAYTDGVVTSITKDAFMGTTIELEHEYGLKSYYMNLSSEIPEHIIVGANVKAGDVIGAVGSSAIVEIADEPQIHFELRVDGKLIDPSNELE